jgi:Uma2 family endonuclease
MSTTVRFTSKDLAQFPDDDGKRYEIIDGELFVSTQPHYYHQRVAFNLGRALEAWSEHGGRGEATLAPGLIFAEDDDVAPDLIWISEERLAFALAPDGKLHAAPELVVEVLSPGRTNERRDREAKLKLYSRRGVEEYWIVDWRARSVAAYRRGPDGLELAVTWQETDCIETPLLDGFKYALAELFKGVSRS